MPRLLVNYWYAPNVGHAVEALRYALGYHAADPALRVSVLLNGATAVELARCCPFLDEVYAVPYTSFVEVDGDPGAALRDVPRAWDFVVENERARQPSHAAFAGFAAFSAAARAHLQPRHPVGVAGAEPPAYVPHQQLRFELPGGARRAARAMLGDAPQAIAVVLAGSSERALYPSTASWELMLTALADRFPEAVILLVGKLAQDGRTTSRVGRDELDRLLRSVPRAVDCFDRPLLEQVALVEASALLVSPHTGFSFVAGCVGTPWLAISGGHWHEYLFNGVPFHSLVPDTTRYPAYGWAELGSGPMPLIEADEDGEGPRTPSMSAARIRDDLPELLDAADRLVAGQVSYEDALAGYVPRLCRAYGGDPAKVFSFDHLHARYLRR